MSNNEDSLDKWMRVYKIHLFFIILIAIATAGFAIYYKQPLNFDTLDNAVHALLIMAVAMIVFANTMPWIMDRAEYWSVPIVITFTIFSYKVFNIFMDISEIPATAHQRNLFAEYVGINIGLIASIAFFFVMGRKISKDADSNPKLYNRG